jgi:signal transduction histidine kinase
LKLAGALAVPMVALVGVAAFEVARADARADEVSQETQLATAAVGPGSLISQLQEERNFAAVDALGMVGALELPVASADEARANTDRAVTDLQAFVDRAGSDVAGAFSSGLEVVDEELADLREAIDASTLPKGTDNAPWANDLFNRYTSIIQVLIDGTAGIAFEVDDAELRTGVELVDLATKNYEVGARLVRSIMLPVLTGDTSMAPRLNVAAQIANLQELEAEMLARSTGPFAGIPEQGVGTEQTMEQMAAFRAYVDTGTTDILLLADTVGTSGEEGSLGIRTLAADALQREADRALDDATRQRQLVLVLAGVMVGLAFVVTVIASRSITRPLRSLTEQAKTMATVRLPQAVQGVLSTAPDEDVEMPEVEEVTVSSRDEVSNVATVLNSVQQSALELAVEQAALRKNIADSFVNLGRRNQNLLDRQLDLITDLERQEQDPERLEELFNLDHLATRMRRNAESLLRLAGGKDVTDGGWGGPVPIVDVVRGALGEVTGYERVEVRGIEPATVTSSAGSDLAHALAELVENALSFSPPDSKVQIRGRHGAEGGYALAVIDDGIGMTDEQLEVANRRLAGEESFTVAPSRYLGHYVAGHLAETLGASIHLEQLPAGGLTAHIDLPASLLVERGPANRPPARPQSDDDGPATEQQPTLVADFPR